MLPFPSVGDGSEIQEVVLLFVADRDATRIAVFTGIDRDARRNDASTHQARVAGHCEAAFLVTG